MLRTTYLNLKKPEGADPVNVQDFNDNADTIDTEVNARVKSSGGDIANTKVSTYTASTASFPVPAAGETPKVFMGKIKKFFEDFKALKDGLVTIGMMSNQNINDQNKIPTSALLYNVNKRVDDVNSDLANLLDRLSAQRTTVPNRLDREATVIQFYKSNGTVSVQMSFQLAWSISKDVADMICAIPTGFNPSAARWVNSDTSNTGKNIQFNVKQNENGVWCLYLTALDNLTATDRINDSFIYQL